jgi:TonB family protein
MRRTLLLSALVALAACVVAQQPSTSPANETRTPVDVRSTNSIGADLTVPLCPQFQDSLARNGIAAPFEKGVTPARTSTTVPALMTQQAVAAAGVTHIGNFNVIVDVLVDEKGVPNDLCLRKSVGYGLDASAAAAVKQYRFAPAKRNGEPVKSRVSVEVPFTTPFPPPTGKSPAGERK